MRNNHQNIYFWERDIQDRQKDDKVSNIESITKFIIQADTCEVILLHDLREKSIKGIAKRDSINNEHKNHGDSYMVSKGLE